jgi:hypothetical protein
MTYIDAKNKTPSHLTRHDDATGRLFNGFYSALGLSKRKNQGLQPRPLGAFAVLPTLSHMELNRIPKATQRMSTVDVASEQSFVQQTILEVGGVT